MISVLGFLKAPTWLGLPLSLLTLVPSFVQAANVTVDFLTPGSGVKSQGEWGAVFTGAGEGYGTSDLNSSLAWNFTGTDLYFMMERGTDYGQGLFVLDGQSYKFDGFSPTPEDDVCGLCITNLPLQPHTLSLTFDSVGRSAFPNSTVLVVATVIYSDGGDDSTGDSGSTSPPSSSGSSSPAPQSTNTLPIAVGAAVGAVGILLAIGIAFYFYRRSNKLAKEAAAKESAYYERQMSYRTPIAIDTHADPATPSSNDVFSPASSLHPKPSTHSRSTHEIHLPERPPARDSVTRNMDVLTAQVQRLANILEDPTMPPPAYEGDSLEE